MCMLYYVTANNIILIYTFGYSHSIFFSWPLFECGLESNAGQLLGLAVSCKKNVKIMLNTLKLLKNDIMFMIKIFSLYILFSYWEKSHSASTGLSRAKELANISSKQNLRYSSSMQECILFWIYWFLIHASVIAVISSMCISKTNNSHTLKPINFILFFSEEVIIRTNICNFYSI